MANRRASSAVALGNAVAHRDQIARIKTPRDRLRALMASLLALCERERQIKPSRRSTTPGYGSSVLPERDCGHRPVVSVGGAWYDEMILVGEDLYRGHLDEFRREGLIR